MKRARFTAAVEKNGIQDTKVILAHDPESVRAHYVRGGYTVHSVRKGDFRRAAKIQEIKSQGRPGRPNIAEIRRVAAAMGLTLPVDVKVSTRENGTLGTHVPQPPTLSIQWLEARTPQAAGFRHVIKVKSWLPAAKMARTIMHELEHAAQFERECMDVPNAHESIRLRHRIYRDGTGYSAKRWEREARAAESNAVNYPNIVR